MRIAKIVNNVVINVIVCDEVLPGWADVSGIVCGPDWSFDGTSYARPTRKHRYRLRDFLARLTADELGSLKEMIDAAASTPKNRAAKALWQYWQSHDVVDFEDDHTTKAMDWLMANTSEWTLARVQELAGGG